MLECVVIKNQLKLKQVDNKDEFGKISKISNLAAKFSIKLLNNLIISKGMIVNYKYLITKENYDDEMVAINKKLNSIRGGSR